MSKLDWLTRSEDEKVSAHVPYRLLEALPEYFYGDPNAENMLIHPRRKYPRRWDELRSAKTPIEAAKLLRKTTAKDITDLYLSEHPEETLHWIHAVSSSRMASTPERLGNVLKNHASKD